MIFDTTKSTQRDSIRCYVLTPKGVIYSKSKIHKCDLFNNSQVKESRFEIFTRNISKLYQNNLAQFTIPKSLKLWQEWTSYYNTVKTTIFGEKRHDKNYGKRL